MVLAVWGLVQAERQEPGFQQLTLTLQAVDAEANGPHSLFTQTKACSLQEAVDTLLLTLWLEGRRSRRPDCSHLSPQQSGMQSRPQALGAGEP